MIRMLAAILLSSCSIFATLPEGISFSPSGMIQYRLRYEILSKKSEDVTKSSGSYSNMIAYKTGLKVSMKQVMFQFEIGNDWGSTEVVSAEKYNYLKKRSDLNPYFSLAFVQWNPEYMHIQAGIVPITGTSVTDLLGASLYSNGNNYKNSSQNPWVALTNGSMQGLRIGAPVKKGNFQLGIDLFSTVITQRKADLSEDFLENADGIMIMMELPMAYKGLTLLPQFIAIPYRDYDKISKEKDHEFLGGIEGKLKINSAFSIRFGYGFALFYQNVLTDTTSSENLVNKKVGMNGGVGSTILLGPGKLDLDVKIGYDEDLKIENSKEVYPFIDTKYAWAVNKFFSITPRVRIFITTTETEKTTVITRPEIMFTGSF